MLGKSKEMGMDFIDVQIFTANHVSLPGGTVSSKVLLSFDEFRGVRSLRPTIEHHASPRPAWSTYVQINLV